jgi:hypothetical protein
MREGDERVKGRDDETVLLCGCGGERGRSEDAQKSGGSSKQWCEQGRCARGEGVCTPIYDTHPHLGSAVCSVQYNDSANVC